MEIRRIVIISILFLTFFSSNAQCRDIEDRILDHEDVILDHDNKVRREAESQGEYFYINSYGQRELTEVGYKAKWDAQEIAQDRAERAEEFRNQEARRNAKFAPDEKEVAYNKMKAEHESALKTISQFKAQYEPNKYDAEIENQKSILVGLIRAKKSNNDPQMKETIYRLNKATRDKMEYRRNFAAGLMANNEYQDALKKSKSAEEKMVSLQKIMKK